MFSSTAASTTIVLMLEQHHQYTVTGRSASAVSAVADRKASSTFEMYNFTFEMYCRSTIIRTTERVSGTSTQSRTAAPQTGQYP